MPFQTNTAPATAYSLAIGNAISGGTNGKLLNIAGGLLSQTDPYSLAIGNAIGGNVSGGILFGNSGNNLAQNATKLFWDQTNERLGLGVASSLTARLQIKGEGATIATKNLLINNSSGTQIGFIDDAGNWVIGTGLPLSGYKLTVNASSYLKDGIFYDGGYLYGSSGNIVLQQSDTAKSANVRNYLRVTGTSGSLANNDPSAAFQIGGTDRGFIPPKPTTGEKNSIAVTGASAGCIVYDTTLNKLCVYTGAAWETITSV